MQPGLRRLTGAGARGLALVELIAYGIAALGLVALMALTVADIALRTVAERRITGAIEFTEVILVIVAFAGMAIAARDQQHVRATLLTDRLPRSAARRVRAIGSLIGVAVLSWMVYGSTLRAVASVQQREMKLGLLDIPVWPARVAIAAGLTVLALVLLVEAVTSFRRPDDVVDPPPQGGLL